MDDRRNHPRRWGYDSYINEAGVLIFVGYHAILLLTSHILWLMETEIDFVRCEHEN